MAAAGAIFGPAGRHAIRMMGETVKILRSKITSATRPLNSELQTVTVRSSGHAAGARQPIHPSALLRQQKRGVRWLSTEAWPSHLHAAVRRYLSTGGRASGAPRFDRSKFPTSSTSRAVSQFTGRAPFASTLRPNLTGGALPRTAGGYGAPGSGRIGGQRYFSHTPAAPAQVVQNVSQAMRAFWLSGQRAQFDGCDARGNNRYRAVSALQDKAQQRMASAPRRAPGSYIDFKISPTVTALSPLAAAFPYATSAKGEFAACLGDDAVLADLSADFARALNGLAAVMADLKRLSALGDLSLELVSPTVLRVRLPGVDADTAEALCDDVGVESGVVGQDAAFDADDGVKLALRFPYAPTSGHRDFVDGHDNAHGIIGYHEKALTSPGGSLRSHLSGLSSVSSSAQEDLLLMEEYLQQNPWLAGSSSPGEAAGARYGYRYGEEGYESMGTESSPVVMTPPTGTATATARASEADFEGLEGIYRFLEECDRPRPRF